MPSQSLPACTGARRRSTLSQSCGAVVTSLRCDGAAMGFALSLNEYTGGFLCASSASAVAYGMTMSSTSFRWSSKSSNFKMQLPLVARILPTVSNRVRLPHPCRVAGYAMMSGVPSENTSRDPARKRIFGAQAATSASVSFSGSPASRLAASNALRASSGASANAFHARTTPETVLRSAMPMAVSPRRIPSAT